MSERSESDARFWAHIEALKAVWKDNDERWLRGEDVMPPPPPFLQEGPSHEDLRHIEQLAAQGGPWGYEGLDGAFTSWLCDGDEEFELSFARAQIELAIEKGEAG